VTFSIVYLKPIKMKILVALLVAMAFVAAGCKQNKQNG
jgi:predicted small secreted protein